MAGGTYMCVPEQVKGTVNELAEHVAGNNTTRNRQKHRTNVQIELKKTTGD